MSREAWEPYEVTLSNTQIAAFVAFLVLAVVGAFAAGAWWGRSGAVDLAEARPAEPASPEPALPADATAPAPAPAPAEVVRFFGAADDEDVEASKASRAAGDAPAADVPAEDTPAEDNPAADVDAASTGAAADAAAAPSRSTGTGLVVQVFSTADLQQAQSVEQRLRADGHRAFLSPQTLDGRAMQRVRVGPFDDRLAAVAAAEQLSKQYGLETWITPNN